jgi:hypothetical protein
VTNPYGRAGRPSPPEHGTRARYLSRTAPCSCGRCRQANADYEAQRRAVAPPIDPIYGRQLRIPGTT